MKILIKRLSPDVIRELRGENARRTELLAMCCMLPIVRSARTGLVQGLTCTAVLCGTAAVLALLRRRLPGTVRSMLGIMTAAWLAAAARLPAGLLDPDFAAAGLMIPLTVTACVILLRPGASAPGNAPGRAALSGLVTGLEFAAAVFALGALREILGSGTFWSIPLFGRAFRGAELFLQTSGGLLLLLPAALCVEAGKSRRPEKEEQA